ncbi:MAG: methyltransferase domain-containing protein [Acidobacteriota bacterium]|nr:methyltransferase domain-containing protein [Acidobacteriota bacterium]
MISLLDQQSISDGDVALSSDVGTRALSVVSVKTGFVHRVYERIASVYDLFYGPTLHAGRLETIKRLAIQPADDVLEVGVGTGINAVLYPDDCNVTGIDLSASMLEGARRRMQRHGVRNVRLMQMDAAKLRFPDESFDLVYAPYVISVVPDPVRVVKEMERVCRTGGRIIVLNHFLSEYRPLARIERALSPMTVHVGFKADLDLQAFLSQAELKPVSIEKVNFPRIWSLVTCVKG